MGKRKSSAKAAPKQKLAPLSTTFKCLFCHHDKAVTVKMDKANMFGHLNCKVCGQKFSAPINNLSAAVDIYCDWVDACEEVRAKQPKALRPKPGPDPLAHGPQGGASISHIGPRSTHANANDDEDEDAQGEDEEDDFDYDASARSKHRDDRNGRSRREDVDEDEDEDEEDFDERPAKAQRRQRADPDEDEDEDD